MENVFPAVRNIRAGKILVKPFPDAAFCREAELRCAVQLSTAMSFGRKFATLILTIGAVGFLFVVVCPLTPTPPALAGNHGSYIVHASMVAAHMAAPASQLIGVRTVSSSQSIAAATLHREADLPHPGYDHLVDLTCARLC